MKSLKAWIFIAISLGWLILAPSILSQNIRSLNKVPGDIESTAQRLTQALQKQGFEVNRGYFKLWNSTDCTYTYSKLGICFGNNPAAPYVALTAPQWADEYVDSKINTVWKPSPPGFDDLFRLDTHEAIIILAQMPPPGKYFAEQSFVFTRSGTFSTTSERYLDIANYPGIPNFILPVFFKYVPDSTDRLISFSSVGEAINNVVIERKATTSFDQKRYFIITPDDYMNKAVREAFAGLKVADNSIFTETIPASLKLGLDQDADDFVTLIRFAQPNDGGALGTPSDNWRKRMPLVALRVRETNHTPEPYTAPVVLGARTANDEAALQTDLDNLISAVHRRWTGAPCAKADCSDMAKTFFDFQQYPIFMQGPMCRDAAENCLGDNWDAAYEVYGRATIDDGEVYAIAGALGTRTGNATYVGLSVNEISRFNGVANLSDKVLDGTAKGYEGEVNNTGFLFLYYFARDCSGLDYLTDKNCYPISETEIPVGTSIAFGLRDYVKPGTALGPDSLLILHPKLIQVR